MLFVVVRSDASPSVGVEPIDARVSLMPCVVDGKAVELE